MADPNTDPNQVIPPSQTGVIPPQPTPPAVPVTPPVMQTVPVTPTPVPAPPSATMTAPTPPVPKEDLSRYTIGGNGGDNNTGPGGSQNNKGSEEVALEKKNAKLYVIGIIIAIIVLLATIVTLYIRAQEAIEEKSSTPTQTETVSEAVEEPSPTPETTPIPRSDISLDILNGSGTAGLAGEVADTFEALGYQILEVGNADEVEGNQLYVNPDMDEDLLTLLLEDVLEELDIASISGELEDSSASAQIVLGS